MEDLRTVRGSVVSGSVLIWSVVGDQLSMIGGLVENLPVCRWKVFRWVGGRWPVGGQWFCNTP